MREKKEEKGETKDIGARAVYARRSASWKHWKTGFRGLGLRDDIADTTGRVAGFDHSARPQWPAFSGNILSHRYGFVREVSPSNVRGIFDYAGYVGRFAPSTMQISVAEARGTIKRPHLGLQRSEISCSKL